MENGSFRSIEKLDFQLPDLEEDFQYSSPLVQENHTDQDEEQRHSMASFGLKKSATIQALLSQNEDLMARLKVTLQRLTKEEDEVQRLAKELESVKQNYSSTSDQMLVWKEKERVWKERNEKLEKTCLTLQEKVRKQLDLESKLGKYQRFHERLKTQVKPYIRQLKDYAQSLQNEITALQSEMNGKEGKIAILSQDLQVAKNLRQASEEAARFQMNELVDSFEKERSFVMQELRALKEQNQSLVHKEVLLSKAEERVDSLENQVIALRRHQEEQGASYRSEIQTIREEHKQLKQSLLQKELECTSQAEQLATLVAENAALTGKLQEAEDQVTSTRYLWKNKSDELEQLQVALQSLERLNRELSQKLSERTQEEIR